MTSFTAKQNVPYEDQATFNFVYYPFSMKLLWAPLVDSCYFPSVGRRKATLMYHKPFCLEKNNNHLALGIIERCRQTWLVAAQLVIGGGMVAASQLVDQLLGTATSPPNITYLTLLFFCLNLAAATQDVGNRPVHTSTNPMFTIELNYLTIFVVVIFEYNRSSRWLS